jgi:hypothetical protein
VGTTLAGPFRGSLGLDLSHEAAERWNGEVKQDGNLGRPEALVAAQLSLGVDTTTFALGARFPFYRHIVVGDEPPGTLESPVILSLGVTSVLPRGGGA